MIEQTIDFNCNLTEESKQKIIKSVKDGFERVLKLSKCMDGEFFEKKKEQTFNKIIEEVTESIFFKDFEINIDNQTSTCSSEEKEPELTEYDMLNIQRLIHDQIKESEKNSLSKYFHPRANIFKDYYKVLSEKEMKNIVLGGRFIKYEDDFKYAFRSSFGVSDCFLVNGK